MQKCQARFGIALASEVQYWLQEIEGGKGHWWQRVRICGTMAHDGPRKVGAPYDDAPLAMLAQLNQERLCYDAIPSARHRLVVQRTYTVAQTI